MSCQQQGQAVRSGYNTCFRLLNIRVGHSSSATKIDLLICFCAILRNSELRYFGKICRYVENSQLRDMVKFQPKICMHYCVITFLPAGSFLATLCRALTSRTPIKRNSSCSMVSACTENCTSYVRVHAHSTLMQCTALYSINSAELSKLIHLTNTSTTAKNQR